MYQPRRTSRSEFVPIRNLRYHVRVWGDCATPGAPTPALPQGGRGEDRGREEEVRPPLVLLHGWMDVSASWQFVVDALARDRHVIAPDWRGYGLTELPQADNYWFPDYLADLDFLLDHYAGDAPVDMVGHSMGGNIAMLYAGVRPQRIRRLVNLEGFGMAPTQAAEAPGRYATWIDQLKAYHRGDMALKPYATADDVALRLMKTNRRLTPDKAGWLARHWAAQDAQGRWNVQGDPAHKIVNASLYRADEVIAIYRCIRARLLSVEAAEDSLERWWKGKYTLADYHQRLQAVSYFRLSRVEDAGHMLHHDQPERLAKLIEAFLDDPASTAAA